MGDAWRAVVAVDAGGPDGWAEPHWSKDGVPWCDDGCRYHDGKRCELLGHRPHYLCEPVVLEMAKLLDRRGGGNG